MDDPSSLPLDITKTIATLVDKHADKLFEVGKEVLSTTAAATRARLKLGYANYIGMVFKNYARSKSFFFRDDPVPLYDFYVPVYAATKKKR